MQPHTIVINFPLQSHEYTVRFDDDYRVLGMYSSNRWVALMYSSFDNVPHENPNQQKGQVWLIFLKLSCSNRFWWGKYLPCWGHSHLSESHRSFENANSEAIFHILTASVMSPFSIPSVSEQSKSASNWQSHYMKRANRKLFCHVSIPSACTYGGCKTIQ